MSKPVNREMMVFQAALDINSAEERERFIERECEGAPDLRASVEDLLAADAEAERFFALSASSLSSLAGELAEDADSLRKRFAAAYEETLGESIGPYRLIEKIGEGGCGVVYRAEQEHPVRRQVALKIIKLGMDTRSVIARFQAERQALAMMDHPNIARVFDAGATERGRPYFVMEFVAGMKITEHCDLKQLGLAARLELFIEVCKAIQHAHQKGIIHRDIKPSNILVTTHDASPTVKVIDFGIAKATEQRLTDETIFTTYAQLIGTPAYMSPEQADLSGSDLDTRSDIYSLGVLLYELLTGRLPFGAKELTRFGVEEMRRTLWERKPRSPSDRLLALEKQEFAAVAKDRSIAPARLVAQLRRDLDCIVLKALEKDRTERYQTAIELAQDVGRFLEDEPVTARPPHPWYRLRKMVRRHRLAVAAGAGMLAILLLAAVTSTWLLFKERDTRKALAAAQREAKVQREAEFFARIAQADMLLERKDFGTADKLLANMRPEKPYPEAASALRKLGRWHAMNRRWREAADRFATLVRAEQPNQLDLAATDYLQLGLALVALGDLDEYERARQEALARYGRAESAFMDSILKFSLLLPANREVLRELAPVAAQVDRAFAAAGAPRNQESGAEAERALAVALFEHRRGELAKAADWCQRCLASAQGTAPRNAAAGAVLAMVRWQMNQHGEALSALLEAPKLIHGNPDAAPKSEVDLEFPWFDWEFARTLLREAEARLSEADRAVTQGSGSRPNFEPAVMLRVLADWHAVRGKWPEASERLTALLQVNGHDDWESVTQDFLAGGATLVKLGKVDEYERFRQEVVRRFTGTDNKTVAERIIKIALLRPADQKTLNALAPFAAVLARAFKVEDGDLPQNVGFQSWAAIASGLLEYRAGNWENAASRARQALAPIENNPLPAQVGRLILALSLHRLGQAEPARIELQQAREFVERNAKNVDLTNWRDWLFASNLLREADEVLQLDAAKVR